MKRIWLIGLVTGCIIISSLYGSEPLQNFDNAVRQSRVEMRQYCALVQELQKHNDSQQKTAAVEYINKSIKYWQKVNAFSKNPPVEYGNDTRFAERLAQISTKLEIMKNKLMADQFQESFDACAEACQLFVTMHEENGLDYALDKLFHLRKAVKKLQKDLTQNDLSVIKKDIHAIQQKRNEVFLTDLYLTPGLAENREYLSCLTQISTAIDELAFDFSNRSDPELQKKVVSLLTILNKAYALAI